MPRKRNKRGSKRSTKRTGTRSKKRTRSRVIERDTLGRFAKRGTGVAKKRTRRKAGPAKKQARRKAKTKKQARKKTGKAAVRGVGRARTAGGLHLLSRKEIDKYTSPTFGQFVRPAGSERLAVYVIITGTFPAYIGDTEKTIPLTLGAMTRAEAKKVTEDDVLAAVADSIQGMEVTSIRGLMQLRVPSVRKGKRIRKKKGNGSKGRRRPRRRGV